jgi:hypothetical protein
LRTFLLPASNLKGGTNPAVASKFIAALSLFVSSAFFPGAGFILSNTETTQSPQAISRITQLSQLMIMI